MNSFWDRASASERRLLLLALAIAVAALAYWTGRAATGRLAYLDARANALEYELLTTAQDAASAEEVNAAYSRIRAQHSSSWTEEQIKDRLLSEIDALTHEHPHTADPGKRIVDRPSLSEATLYVSDEGFREYRASFEMRNVAFGNLVRFLRRIQESPQALRIEELALQREPVKSLVSKVEMKVTRTVVEGSGEEDASPKVDLVRNPGFETWTPDTGTPAHWTAEGGSVARDMEMATEGECALRFTAAEAGAKLYQIVAIPATGLYRLEMDVYSDAPFVVGIEDNASGETLAGPAQVAGASATRHVAFNVNIESGAAPIDARAPEITLSAAGQVICVDNVSLRRVE